MKPYRILSAIALTAALTLGLIGQAQAACSNRYLPQAALYQQFTQADGSIYLQLRVSDADYPSYPRIIVTDQNGATVANVASIYWGGSVPRGKMYRFSAPNMTTCKGFYSYYEFWRVDNRR